MPQDTETTGAASGINYSDAQMNNLLAKVTTGQIIFATDVQTLLDYYSDFRTHNHAVTDTRVVDNFGNTAGDQSASDAETTGNPNGTNALPGDPATGTTITAVKHNEIRNALNSLRAHTHTWDDN
jgi:hypothetical protein